MRPGRTYTIVAFHFPPRNGKPLTTASDENAKGMARRAPRTAS